MYVPNLHACLLCAVTYLNLRLVFSNRSACRMTQETNVKQASGLQKMEHDNIVWMPGTDERISE